MDALVALLDPAHTERRAADVSRMLDALWPPTSRQEAVFPGEGLTLAAARTRPGADALGQPAVRSAGSLKLVQRFDWPTLASPAATAWLDAFTGEGVGVVPGTVAAPTAFAWDEETRTLIVARDAMGESPVWYTRQAGRLGVATHPAALRALPWVSDDPDPIGAVAFQVRAPLLAEETRWRDIRRLPPGYLLIARAGEITIRRWWTLATRPLDPPPRDADWAPLVRRELEAAVARRLPLSGIVGTQLSGGLDSSAVALLASRVLTPLGRPIHTFSHVPPVRWNPPQRGDETPFVEAALACMPTAVPHFATGEAGTVVSPADPLHPHDQQVRDAARAAGVSTILSGWGGDEGVSYNGDGVFAGELLRGRVWWLRACLAAPRPLLGVAPGEENPG